MNNKYCYICCHVDPAAVKSEMPAEQNQPELDSITENTSEVVQDL